MFTGFDFNVIVNAKGGSWSAKLGDILFSPEDLYIMGYFILNSMENWIFQSIY